MGSLAAVFAKSQAPDALICKSPASSSTVAWTMYQKYANGMPLYRQEKDWKQYGAAISRTTLANWIIYCAEHYFQPVYHYLHRLLLKRQFAMADETRIQVLNEPERRAETQSFMWLFRSGEDGLPVIILYGYTPTRSGDNAAEFLQGFQGYLEADGYQGYNKVPGIRRCSCWSHIRRYFIDAVPKGKQFDYSQPAVQGVSTATAYSGWRMQSTGRPGKITKNAGSFVSRRRNRFLRLFGRGLTVFSRYGTPDWTKQSLISGTAGARQRHIWKTADAALQTI